MESDRITACVCACMSASLSACVCCITPICYLHNETQPGRPDQHAAKTKTSPSLLHHSSITWLLPHLTLCAILKGAYKLILPHRQIPPLHLVTPICVIHQNGFMSFSPWRYEAHRRPMQFVPLSQWNTSITSLLRFKCDHLNTQLWGPRQRI